MRATNDIRKRELAQIHIAKAQLGLDDDIYRDMLWAIARVRSAADLDFAGRKKVLDHLKAKGFKPKGRKQAGNAQAAKIRALWLDLHAASAVRDASEKALTSYVKRITSRDALQWLNPRESSHVIETLKKWLARVQKDHDVG